MQNVSQTYIDILNGEHYFETRLNIAGTNYGMSDLISVRASQELFSGGKPTVGGCVAGTLEVEMFEPAAAIPRMAEVKPYVRACSAVSSAVSEWIPKGVYYIDTRAATRTHDGQGILTFTCYDRMIRAEQPAPALTPPQTDSAVVSAIAALMGCGIDARTTALINKAYPVGMLEGWTCRETLGMIAGLYGGNFVMNDLGQLLLVTLGGLPRETNYLTVADGQAVTQYITLPLDGIECRVLLQEAV